jgi:AraC-like DNA-binding protein
VVTISAAAGPTDTVTRSHVDIDDPDKAAAFLESSYGVRLRLSVLDPRRDGGALLSHTRFDAGAFAIEEVSVAGELKSAPDALEKVRVLWVHRGAIESDCEGMSGIAGAGDLTMTAQHDLPYETRSRDLTMTAVLLDPQLVASVATGLPVDTAPLPIRFLEFEPTDARASRLWKETVTFVKETLLGADAAATPLVLGQAGRLLAAATLAAFPNTIASDRGKRDSTDQPVLLRRAVEFIEANADQDIALADIAHAVHVSSRAVQYMFRRHLDTTPLQYLRRLRLQHAHEDLTTANRSTDTVAGIAARWQFTHTGRFAVSYREVYGHSPHETLRG